MNVEVPTKKSLSPVKCSNGGEKEGERDRREGQKWKETKKKVRTADGGKEGGERTDKEEDKNVRDGWDLE